jgi:hypothetical protein
MAGGLTQGAQSGAKLGQEYSTRQSLKELGEQIKKWSESDDPADRDRALHGGFLMQQVGHYMGMPKISPFGAGPNSAATPDAQYPLPLDPSLKAGTPVPTDSAAPAAGLTSGSGS